MVWTSEKGGGGVLNEVEELRVEGQQPVGRPKKKWSGCVTEDKNILGIEEYVYGTRLTNMEGSHRPSNPTLIGKIWTFRTMMMMMMILRSQKMDLFTR